MRIINKRELLNHLEDNIIILDGATGTELQERGMPKDVCPEQWVLQNPETIIDIQRKYILAGSNAVYTCTFGANRIKLSEFGLQENVRQINKDLAMLSRRTAKEKVFVVGSVAPTGRFIKPFGDIAFEEVVNIYKEQVQGLLEGGVDFFVIETMIDLQETRAALLAVLESCDLPVCVSLTFEVNGRTLTGTDPKTAVITLQSLGADAVGCNCSTGPSDMLKIIEQMSKVAKVPLIAKPNAGIPKLIDNKTVFDMQPQDFASYTKSFMDLGVRLIGGCCGTTPRHIEALKNNLTKPSLFKIPQKDFSILTSSRKSVHIGADTPLVIVGERINPTGKKKLQEDLKEGKTLEVRRLAIEQISSGASILDVNVGMPGINEKETMVSTVEFLSSIVDSPLCIDSSSPDVIENALRVYPGRALINSISFEKSKIERLIPIAKKYGAMFIILPLDDNGIPSTFEARIDIIQKIFRFANKFGICKSDIVVDGLAMTASSDQNAAKLTLETIDWCSNVLKCNTIVGLSNISFGLPNRSWINAAFLVMAMGRGLSMAIANPLAEILINLKYASDALVNRDRNCKYYVEHFTKNEHTTDDRNANKDKDLRPVERLYNTILQGDKDNVIGIIDAVLKENIEPKVIVDEYLIPAINHVGELYETKKYFLPQLINSAETMKKAFEFLEPMLKTDETNKTSTTIVLATVKGDIHDIGKNIVALMLKNYGFTVIDLGKNVPTLTIINKAKELNAKIIGLSALMTTTMVEMKEVIRLAKESDQDFKIIVGGAVVTSQYADEIGADGYSRDAYEAVHLARKLLYN